MTRPTTKEIEEVQNDLFDSEQGGLKNPFPGMTYTEGVDAALRWVLGHTDDKPMEE